jgi:hypothetical protein
MGDWAIRITIMRLAPDKGNGFGYMIALHPAKDGLFWFGGAEIINAEIKCCLWLERTSANPNRNRRRHIHHRENGPRGNYACSGIANKTFLVGQSKFTPIAAMRMIFNANHFVMPVAHQLLDKSHRIKIIGESCHSLGLATLGDRRKYQCWSATGCMANV